MPDATELSYERLASIRTAACQLLNSGALYLHEQAHLTEIIARLDQKIQLNRQRDQAKGDRSAASDTPPDRHTSPA